MVEVRIYCRRRLNCFTVSIAGAVRVVSRRACRLIDDEQRSLDDIRRRGVRFATSKRDMRQRLPGNDQHLISDGPSEASSVWRVRLAAAHADVDAEIDLDATNENARLPADVRRMRGCLARRA